MSYFVVHLEGIPPVSLSIYILTPFETGRVGPYEQRPGNFKRCKYRRKICPARGMWCVLVNRPFPKMVFPLGTSPTQKVGGRFIIALTGDACASLYGAKSLVLAFHLWRQAAYLLCGQVRVCDCTGWLYRVVVEGVAGAYEPFK